MSTGDIPEVTGRLPAECMLLLRELKAALELGDTALCVELQTQANACLRTYGYRVYEHTEEYFKLRHESQLSRDGARPRDAGELYARIFRMEELLIEAGVLQPRKPETAEEAALNKERMARQSARMREINAAGRAGDYETQIRMVKEDEEASRRAGRSNHCHPEGYWELLLEWYRAREANDLERAEILERIRKEIDEEEDIKELLFINR